MHDNKIIQAIYTLFLGVLLALFVGVGINTFYPGPKAPEYPAESQAYKTDPTPAQDIKQKEFDAKMKAYDQSNQTHSRNTSMIALIAAILLLVVSVFAQDKLKELTDGVMLGGFFTLLYSIILGFVSQNDKYTFIVITIGLVLVMHQGYVRLNQPHSKKK